MSQTPPPPDANSALADSPQLPALGARPAQKEGAYETASRTRHPVSDLLLTSATADYPSAA
jgi:hypothetical protein